MAFNKIKRNKSIFPIFLTYFLDTFGLAIIYPIFTPLFLKSDSSILASATPYLERTLLLGLVLSAFPLAQFFGAPLLGQFSDRFGRKLAFYISIFGTSICYALTALSIESQSFVLLFIARFCSGLFAGNLTLCLASIADMSPDDVSRSRNFGLIGAISGLSFIVAMAYGGFLSNPSLNRHFGPSLPFWITSLLSFTNFVFMILMFKETHAPSHDPGFNPFKGVTNLKEGIQNKELRVLYLVNFLFMFSWVSSLQFLPSMLLSQFQMSLLAITTVLMIVGVVWASSNYFINQHLIKRYYSGKVLIVSLFFLSLLLLCTLSTHVFSTFLLFFFPSAIFASLCWTNGITTVSIKAPSAIQGSILGINQSLSALAALFSPPIGGLLAGINGHAVYFFAGLLTLFSFTLLLITKSYQNIPHE